MPDVEAERDLWVRGWGHALREALVNLVLNAIDAMPEGGRLTLRAGRDGNGEDARIFIEVADTGVGMDDEIRRRCLEPFFTTKDVGGGTGLGLAISHSVVSAHGGRITLESLPGAGSTFRIVLPAGTVAGAVPSGDGAGAPARNPAAARSS